MTNGAVYRHINAAGETLYIGCTVNPMQRTATHRSVSPWITEVVRIDIMWFQTHAEAIEVEDRLIRAEAPPYNKRKTPREPKRSRTQGPALLAAWMTKAEVDDAQLAYALGVTKSQVQSLLKPTASPRHVRQRCISVVTSGEVPSGAWHRTDPSAAASPEDAVESRSLLEHWGIPVPSPIIPTSTAGSTT